MSIRFSVGLRNKMLGSQSLKTAMDLGFIEYYTGVQPSEARLAPTGRMLLRVSNDGGVTGLTFDMPSGGIIAKTPAEIWKGVGADDGTVGWARFVSATDTGVDSDTDARIDFSVARTGGDLNVSNTSIVTGAPSTIDVFQLTMADTCNG